MCQIEANETQVEKFVLSVSERLGIKLLLSKWGSSLIFYEGVKERFLIG